MHHDNIPLGTKGARTQPWPNMILDGANYACNHGRMKHERSGRGRGKEKREEAEERRRARARERETKTEKPENKTDEEERRDTCRERGKRELLYN